MLHQKVHFSADLVTPKEWPGIQALVEIELGRRDCRTRQVSVKLNVG